MKLYYWSSPRGNFGDDLNRELWPALLGERLEDENETLLLGVGTVLNDDVPRARRRLVLGAGSGYGFPPKLRQGGWDFRAVRGPLTGAVISAAGTIPLGDGALLIDAIRGLGTSGEGVASSGRPGTCFVPHWMTYEQELPTLAEACRRGNVHLVDPRASVASVVQQIAASELVIAESLHAAIVVDVYAVPWMGAVFVRDTPFKWWDWCLSLEMDYVRITTSGTAKEPIGPAAAVTSFLRRRPGTRRKFRRALGQSDKTTGPRAEPPTEARVEPESTPGACCRHGACSSDDSRSCSTPFAPSSA